MSYKEVKLVFFAVLLVLFFFSVLSLFTIKWANKISGLAAEQSTVSRVQVQAFFSIAKSNDLNTIDFGTVANLANANDLNASQNYNGPNNGTLYYLAVTDSNVGVDFCIRGTSLQNSAGDIIDIGNYSWSNSTINNFTDFNQPPPASQSVVLSTTFEGSAKNVLNGQNAYYRFYLDIPPNTNPGIYNNTVYFKGVVSGGAC
ncbi:hypothetical protein HYX18_00920 [Candidatus Woesearchaeota archaeon]|nr:hypothetical protein [Candidatus Woesearchaeota archaeon]